MEEVIGALPLDETASAIKGETVVGTATLIARRTIDTSPPTEIPP
jgi:hypothetical protein